MHVFSNECNVKYADAMDALNQAIHRVGSLLDKPPGSHRAALA